MTPSQDTKTGEAAKPLPCNIEAEQALLGCVLYDNAALEAAEAIRADDFSDPIHGLIWFVIQEFVAANRQAEPIGVSQRLTDEPGFKDLGGMRYLADLVDVAPPLSGAKHFAQLLKESAVKRSVAKLARDLEALALSGEEAPAVMEAAERGVAALSEREEQTGGGFSPFADAMDGAMAMVADAMGRQGGLAGMSTGLMDLDQKTGGLAPSDLLILAGRPSMGKAQPLDAKVLMRDGSWKAMGDLRIGDHLASIDGGPSRVAGVFPQGQRQTYRVTLGDGRTTRACGEHLWSIKSSKLPHGEAVVSTDHLRLMLEKERYRRRVSLPLVSGHFGEDDGLLIDPWLLGALIGNGCMVTDRLSFSTADAATLYRVQKVVGHDCVVPDGGGYDYRLNQGGDASLRVALATYGLIGKRSEDKFIPEPYLRASREARLELLRGLMDTDGWVETFGVVRYCSASRQLAEDVQTLVRSLGGSCTISTKAPTFTHKGERKTGLPAHVCNIRHADRPSLMSLKRKQRRCEAPARFKAPTIVSIEPAAIEPVQCIRVTHPSALYITDDYIVTHNTALATNIAFNVAKRYAYEPQPDGTRKTVTGGRVAFFSLEMSKEQLSLRIAADAAGISGDRVRKGEIDFAEFARIRECTDMIKQMPLWIDDTGGLNLHRLCARARRLKRTKGVDLIIVDYLQLITGAGGSDGNRTQEVSQITMGLKALAKELNVPVIALSQLSRQVENRPDKRPQLADLRESGSIEQDADMVMFVYRESYYLGRAEPDAGDQHKHLEWAEKMDRLAGIAEVIIGKARHGPIGTVRLHFNEDLTRFGNLAREGRFQ